VERGAVVKRGDTGTFALVISNDMVHRAVDRVTLCTIMLAPRLGDHAALVPIGDGMTVVPTNLNSVPRSAIAEVLRHIDDDLLAQCERIAQASIGP
jgi:mRNA-degrading endonuclease toxin of MazEF toxin-antitoxin module